MKKLMTLMLAAVMMLSVCLPALADDNMDDRRLVARGSASVTLPADTARIELGMVTKDSSVEAAQAQNDQVIRAVLSALKEIGIAERDISTSNYSVYTETPYEEYGSIRKADPVYNVSNMLNIKVRNLDDVGRIVDKASKAGVNQVYGLTFSSSEENAAYRQAIEKAVEDAKQNAQVLAKAAGKTLGVLLRVEDQASYQAYDGGRAHALMEDGAGAGPEIVGGEITVTASVMLVYEID